MNKIMRKVDWVSVGGKWTRMSVMGKHLDENVLKLETRPTSEENRIVILMIPGNPGNEQFYEHFGRRLLENLDENKERSSQNQYLFFTVSSLNHVLMPNSLNGKNNHFNSDLFSLEEQVNHKFNFVQEYLPRGKEIYIFGHSIGSYMMLRILNQVVKEGFNVRKAVALFPTIEHMATSPNGQKLGNVLAILNNHDWLTKSLTFWIDYLPETVKRFLVGLNLREAEIPKEIVDASLELLNMNVVRNIIHMSNDELNQVVSLNENLLENNELIRFYYGLKDGWCPIKHGFEMRNRLGNEKVTLDEDDCEHAFVIKDGEIMAKNVLKYFD